MSLENLLLRQQMSKTQARLADTYEDEEARRKKGGFWSGIGGGVGGLLGGLGASALATALGVATGGLAVPLMVGAGAGLGSLTGSRIGADLGGGREHDAVKLGKNIDALTGEKKEYTKSVKDRYRKNVSNFQDQFNTQILGSAIKTGLQAGTMAYFNPVGTAEIGNKLTGGKAVGANQVVDASGNVVNIPQANIAGAQAYQPAGLGDPTSQFGIQRSSMIAKGNLPTPSAPITPTGNILPSATSMNLATAPASSTAMAQPNNLLNMASAPTSSMSGMGPLSNQAYDAASSVSNPFIPESITNIGGLPSNYSPVMNPQAYNNALNRANYMRSLGLNLPSNLGGI